jgi:uncharacterized Zn-binding protein involved in type VI secretion
MPAISRDKIDLAATGHGCDSTAGVRASQFSVFANGISILRPGDRLLPHTILVPCPPGVCCVGHPAKINAGSSSVFIGNVPVARIGDSADNSAMIQGSPNVFAGG